MMQSGCSVGTSDKTIRGKDDIARQIARKYGIQEGLICVFSAMELANCFSFVGGAIVGLILAFHEIQA
jgi:hypothetical protein